MDKYNEGSTFDRDDAALIADTAAGTGATPGATAAARAEDVGETTPGVADTTVGAVDAADVEFAETADDSGSAEDSVPDGEPSEPIDRFDDDDTSSGPELTDVPSELQASTQGDDPIFAELGEDGQGDLAPEDQV